jgi:hypothetical protein
MEELERLKSERQDLSNKIWEMQRKEKIARNNELIGKCYKYRNSYGSDTEWWLYSRVVSVDEDGYMLANSFQDDGEGRLEVRRSASFMPLGGEIEITEVEYLEASGVVIDFAKKVATLDD